MVVKFYRGLTVFIILIFTVAATETVFILCIISTLLATKSRRGDRGEGTIIAAILSNRTVAAPGFFILNYEIPTDKRVFF